ncbi:putative protease Do-like 13 [Aegilops tauschii subsp. strangulata]|uniref:Serine protease n=3 Tax=Aegilops tauschii TaxID=37682 RepID=A0A453J4V0_AEGTS|nr:putative protease Do-like 13 [Aegilops tauschii subsp. strangulata]
MMSVVSLVYASSPRGSGFIVYASPEAFLAMTCEHVVRGYRELQIFFPGETKAYKARVLRHDPTIDLALISFLPDGDCLQRRVPLRFADLNAPLNCGAVRMIGYHQVPQGRLLSPGVFDGNLTVQEADQTDDPEMKLRSIQFLNCNYASEPGTSGGPILKGNRVVGVNSDSFGGHKFSISVIGVCNTLRRWLNMENSGVGIDDMLAMLARE